MERLRLLVEGVNNKIRVLQRRAYGYRDEEYLKLKIVAAFLPVWSKYSNAQRVRSLHVSRIDADIEDREAA